jgi:hypothetical protein
LAGLPFQAPPIYIHIWTFGLKIHHLATLIVIIVCASQLAPPKTIVSAEKWFSRKYVTIYSYYIFLYFYILLFILFASAIVDRLVLKRSRRNPAMNLLFQTLFANPVLALDQGCQIGRKFKPKIPILGKFWRVLQWKMLVY